jgi:enoyl-CoA hydratase
MPIGRLRIRQPGNAPQALAAAKKVLRASQGLDDPAAFARLDDLIAGLTSSRDAREGAMAFFEKRKPVWQGR